MSKESDLPLEIFRLPVNIKLSLLWTSLMFLYIYNDYFSMYLPGDIEGIAAGQMGPLGEATDIILVSVSILLAVPALMIFLSAVLPAIFSRWLNVLTGLVYTLVEAASFPESALFYQIIVVIEMVLTVLIVWYAMRWPRKEVSDESAQSRSGSSS